MKDKLQVFFLCLFVGGSLVATAIYAKTYNDPLALIAWFSVSLLLCAAGG